MSRTIAGRPWARTDMLVLAALGLTAAFCSWFWFWHYPRFLYQDAAMDIWFDTDIPKILENMLDRTHGHQRTGKHPIFSLLGWTATTLLRGTGLNPLQAVSVLLVANAAVFAGLLYYMLRLAGLGRASAGLLGLAAIASAAFSSYAGLVETFPFGATTILIGLLPAAWLTAGKKVGTGAWIASVAASMTMIVTDIGAGIASLLVAYLPPLAREHDLAAIRRTLIRMTVIVGSAVGIVLALSIVQNIFFGDASLFINPEAITGETRFTIFNMGGLWGGIWDRLQILVIGPWVSGPAIPPAAVHDPVCYMVCAMRVAPPLGAGPLSMGVGLAWMALLVAGIVEAVRNPHNLLGRAALLTLAGNLTLHTVYGLHPFLYVFNLLPMELILVAGAGAYLGRAFAPILLVLTPLTALLSYQFHMAALDSAGQLYHQVFG